MQLQLQTVRCEDCQAEEVLLHPDDAGGLGDFLDGAPVVVCRINTERIAVLTGRIDAKGVIRGKGVALLAPSVCDGHGLQDGTSVLIESVRTRQPALVAIARIERVADENPIDPEVPWRRLRKGPERLVILFDNSGSMYGEPLAEAKDALRILIFQKLRLRVRDAAGITDEVGLIRFGGDGAEVVFAPTRAYASRIPEILGLEADGGTPMQEALELSVPLFDDWSGPNRRLILISDGGASVNSECVDKLAGAGIQVVAVSIGGPTNSTLAGLATATCGVVLEVTELARLESIFARLA